MHKIDRLARNRADDVEINALIAKAGAKLLSVAEPVDETPAGKLLYNMMADVAQYHSDNLAVEVLKGMDTKAKRGGTPFRAPIGYLNRKEFIDNARHSYVIIDPERAPLIRWAFEQYALGTWTLRRLTDALEAQGLTTRPSRKRVAKPVSLNGLNVILRSPYYMGVVPYRGIYYEGKHELLVSAELWLRVQDILSAHHLAGDKEFKHYHYLKGSIFCGECGMRLVYSRNRGRGGEYEYYKCYSRTARGRHCSRRYTPLDKIEAGVERLYAAFRLSPAKAELIRSGVLDELPVSRQEAAQEADRAKKRLRDVEAQQSKPLHAHYAGAVPVELMKSEMERLTREKAEAEASLASTRESVEQVEGTLAAALAIASTCDRQYLTAKPAQRRLLNQGFFKKLYIDADGEVERFELTEPFATLLDRSLLEQLTVARDGTAAGQRDSVAGRGTRT